MTLQTERCDDCDLSVLLDGDDNSPRYRLAAEHVEHCDECQQRLTDLSADQGYWRTQRDMLQPLHGDDGSTGWLRRQRVDSYSLGHRLADEVSVRELLAPPSHPELLGRLGRYEVERIIGMGGMGIVLKAFDGELNRPVAIKLLAPHLARVGAARQRFAREARAAAAVVHEHVVPIYDVVSESSHPYLVMQIIPGESLQSRVERDGPLSVAEILRIGVQAASGLAAAHAQGLVHRDVKPANILLENGVERAYLTDFGLARASDDASLTYTGVVAGTPHYMSPEQADGQPLDHRSDLFSLGSVLYFMATGHPPFRADRPMAVLKRTCHDPHRPVSQFNAEIPRELSSVIDRLLSKQPAQRFATADELQRELAMLLSCVQQGQLSVGKGRSTWQRRHWIGVAGMLASIALVAAISAWRLTLPSVEKSSETDRQTQAEHEASRSGELLAVKTNELLATDPSPSSTAQGELETLSQMLDVLEGTPFPLATEIPSSAQGTKDSASDLVPLGESSR